MKRFDLFRPEAVYMDCVMSRLDPRAEVGLDPRPHVASITQAHPIGARLESWNANYKTAMDQASFMIFVETSEWSASEWCRKEYTQFHLENGKRRLSRRPALQGIRLIFDESANLWFTGAEYLSALRVSKSYSVQHGLLWDRDDWGMSETDLAGLFSMIAAEQINSDV